MFARGAWAWLGWVAIGGSIAAIGLNLTPMALAHPVGTSDRQAYDLATKDFFPGLPMQHVEYLDSIPGFASADGLYQPSRSTLDIRVRDGTLGRDEYVAVLRHEYGHALIYTWCETASYGEAAFNEVVHATRQTTRHVPPQLGGAALEYRARPGRYGSYADSSFAEWLAEAYAAYVAGDETPPRTRAFFDSLRPKTAARCGP